MHYAYPQAASLPTLYPCLLTMINAKGNTEHQRMGLKPEGRVSISTQNEKNSMEKTEIHSKKL